MSGLREAIKTHSKLVTALFILMFIMSMAFLETYQRWRNNYTTVHYELGEIYKIVNQILERGVKCVK